MHKNESGAAHLVLILVAVLALVGIAGSYVATKNRAKEISREATQTKQSSDLVSPLPSDLLTADAVKELAASEAPSIDILGIELEQEDGVFLYKVKLANGQVLYFNAQTGAKTTHDHAEEDENETDAALPAGFVAGISFDKAREIASAQKPDGVIEKIELEQEDGVVVYSVRFTDDARIDVDATSGAIVRTKAADDDSDNNESESDDDEDSSQDDSEDSENDESEESEDN